jgi:YbgC/YbaW family acyl-CoA thioester hydrolase
MREKKLLSSKPYIYQTNITVQIDDINYGGHVGNERYLLFAQETRMRFLQTIGHTEINFGEFGIVVAEAGIEYFTELFHGDLITISISIDNITRVAFDCYYKIEKTLNEKTIIAACIKTNMVCYDYKEKKVRSIPEDIRNKFNEMIGSN